MRHTEVMFSLGCVVIALKEVDQEHNSLHKKSLRCEHFVEWYIQCTSSLKIALLSGKKSSRNFGWDAHGYDAPSALRRAAELFEGLLAEAPHEISCH